MHGDQPTRKGTTDPKNNGENVAVRLVAESGFQSQVCSDTVIAFGVSVHVVDRVESVSSFPFRPLGEFLVKPDFHWTVSPSEI